MQKLIDFQTDASRSTWVTVNDGVMGGESQGQVEVEAGKLQFTGTLSLANQGGFASVRTHDQLFDFSRFSHVIMRVRGDGRSYQLRLGTDATHEGKPVSYGAPFTTRAGEWINVRVDLAALEPSVRGTALDGPPLERSRVREIGLLISDGRAGEFSLEVEWIAVE